jgi:PST family polysaccharide transporter
LKHQPGRFSLASALSKGALWVFTQTAATRLLQVLVQIVLAWLLTPEDFGEVGITLAISGIISACFAFGLEDVLLQRGRAMRLWAGSVFWVSLGIGFAGAAALLTAAPIAALVYGQPRLAALIAIAAIGSPVAALEILPGTFLRSRLDFFSISLVTFAEAVVAGGLSVVLAGLGFGPYSLVLPSPVAAAARVAALWLIARPGVSLASSGRRWRLLMPSAWASLGTRLLYTVIRQTDYVILGLFVGEAEVGVYYFAFKLAIQPLRMLAGSLSTVLFPALVQLRDDRQRQLDAALLVSEMVAIIAMPVCFLQAALAGPVLTLLFGTKWDATRPLIELLSIGLAFDSVSWTAGSLLPARGEFGRNFRYAAILAPTAAVLVGIGAFVGGAVGTAAAVAAYFAVVQPLFSYAVFKGSGRVGWRAVASLYVMPASICAVTIGSAAWFLDLIAASNLLRICAMPILTFAAYVPLIRVACPTATGLLLDRVLGFRSKWQREHRAATRAQPVPQGIDPIERKLPR